MCLFVCVLPMFGYMAVGKRRDRRSNTSYYLWNFNVAVLMTCGDLSQILRNCAAATAVAAADDDYDVAGDGNEETHYGWSIHACFEN